MKIKASTKTTDVPPPVAIHLWLNGRHCRARQLGQQGLGCVHLWLQRLSVMNE